MVEGAVSRQGGAGVRPELMEDNREELDSGVYRLYRMRRVAGSVDCGDAEKNTPPPAAKRCDLPTRGEVQE
jgi:hypothetical protein